MARRRAVSIPDLYSDPFGERSAVIGRERMQVMGCDVEFESNSAKLLALVRTAYARLPGHRLATHAPELKIRLWLTDGVASHRRSEPPPLAMFAGTGLLGGVSNSSSCVVLSSDQRAALIAVSPAMLRFPYHTRYELVEFAVFTLASRVQRLVPLHAACVGRNGHGVLLMGASGSGKSTVSLLCLLAGFEFLAEDSVFVAPGELLATGVANFVHVRASSLRWVAQEREKVAIRKAPVIRRRSGVRKYELDLRQRRYRLASGPQKIRSLVFLSAAATGDEPLLRVLPKAEMLARVVAAQAYAAGQPEWPLFCDRLAQIDTFELRRGRHPSESVQALEDLVRPGAH